MIHYDDMAMWLRINIGFRRSGKLENYADRALESPAQKCHWETARKRNRGIRTIIIEALWRPRVHIEYNVTQ